MIPGWGRARASTPFLCSLGFFHKWNLRPFCDKTRREDPYWPEGKRLAVEDRYRPDLPRPDHRFHDCDHRDRGQYQDHVADRSVPPAVAVPLRPGPLVRFLLHHPRCTWALEPGPEQGAKSVVPSTSSTCPAGGASELVSRAVLVTDGT